MVVRDSRSFSSLVSPQIPMIFESSAVHEIIRLSDSGVTVWMSAPASLVDRVASAYGIGINLEDVFVESGIDPNDIPHLMVDFQLQWRHGSIKVNSIQELQQQDLRISFSSITSLGSILTGFSDLDHYHVSVDQISVERRTAGDVRYDVTLVLI
jgi:hypothetical protein